ncbi:secretion protein [Burkholderia sp. Bp9126]|nr:secretion protein [Burkholderia sp. Bp9126]
MAFMHAHARLLIEIVDGRFALSLASTVHVSQGRDAFIRLLEHCDPMRMHGLSLHAFLARDQLVLGCVFPRHTSIDDWIRYYRLMSRLLNNHIRGAT